MLENVDDLTESLHEGALDEIRASAAEIGYDTHVFVIDAADYACCLHKSRMFLLGVSRPLQGFIIYDYNAFFLRISKLLETFKVQGARAPSLPLALLPPTHASLTMWLESRAAKPVKPWEPNSMRTHRAAWVAEGWRWIPDPALPLSIPSTEWLRTLTAREKDNLVFRTLCRSTQAAEMRRAATESKLLTVPSAADAAEIRQVEARCAAIDVNASIHQPATSVCSTEGRLISCTILPGSKLYLNIPAGAWGNGSVPHNRLLHGREALTFIGWPAEDKRFAGLINGASHNFLNELAGNCFAPTIIAAFLIAIGFSIDAAVKTGEDEEDDGSCPT